MAQLSSGSGQSCQLAVRPTGAFTRLRQNLEMRETNKMRRTFMIAAALSAVVAFTGAALAADVEMTVSNQYGYANLRQGPGTTNKLLERLPEGTKVIAIEKVAGGTWIHVKVGVKEGYIQAKLLK
jgi:uncharacterized protein YraI